MLKLLAPISAALALAPAKPEIISASGRDRRQPPSWYPNGPVAWARERGLEPEDVAEEPKQPAPALRSKATASWLRLVKDLDRRPTRDRARELIETRVPSEALDWLRDMIREEDWLALRLVGHDRTAEEIRERALWAARRWEAMHVPPTPPAAPGVPDETDDITPPAGPRPR
ncbi:hypothetical protein NOF55_20885 [Rhizobiaceae bacterium BDR2-2]|uniref:Uncharacterized protein n=1 Tax=Ectorhizobium quercum TaxID=2965071 RepID=A0AAE3SYI1_9HYPH|nr:hypothetical protein [Ectorhizobium quercum]MCX8999565.1 hypothetical protein [Ectorhizobium quercum]